MDYAKDMGSGNPKMEAKHTQGNGSKERLVAMANTVKKINLSIRATS
jgi:hypothetical protein